MFPDQIPDQTAKDWAFEFAVGIYTEAEISEAVRDVSVSIQYRPKLAHVFESASRARENAARKAAYRRENAVAIPASNDRDPIMAAAAIEVQKWVEAVIAQRRSDWLSRNEKPPKGTHPPTEAPTNAEIDARFAATVKRMREDKRYASVSQNDIISRVARSKT